jgi:hypothetical protein
MGGLILCGGRFLDFAPVLAVARTEAALGMTGGWHCSFDYAQDKSGRNDMD